MDQFITRVICENNKIKFLVKDDLLDGKRFNIDPIYFDEAKVKSMAKVLARMFKGRKLETVDPMEIVN